MEPVGIELGLESLGKLLPILARDKAKIRQK